MKDINATVIVDLNPKEEDILKSMHKDARWGINRAVKEGLTVEETNSDADWQKLYDIYRNTMIEGGTKIKPLEELKKNSSVLLVCKKSDKIIAGASIWFADKYNMKVPRLYLNASMKEHQNLQPNNLLYWKCIVWSKNKGYDSFDLGGYQIKAREHLNGINKFKEKFGKVVYYDKQYPFFKAIGRKFIRNFRFFWWLNKKLRN